MAEFGWADIRSGVLGGGPEGALQHRTSELSLTGSNSLKYSTNTSTLTLSGTLNVSGTINANQFNLDVVNKTVTNINSDGSTVFGDSTGDLHQLTGSLAVSGSSNVILYANASNGRVGIGTDSPSYSLQVLGNVGVGDHIYHNDDADTYINFTSSGNAIYLVASGTTGLSIRGDTTPKKIEADNYDFNLVGNSNNSMFFADFSADKIGIGTTEPNEKLEVVGNTVLSGTLKVTSSSELQSTTVTLLSSSGYVKFEGELSGSDNFYVNSTGVGIGVSNPTEKLEVAGNITINEKIIHNGDTDTYVTFPSANRIGLTAGGEHALTIYGNTSPKRIEIDNYDFKVIGTSNSDMIFADFSTDKVGIMTSVPTHTLSVSGTLSVSSSATFHSSLSASSFISASHFYGNGAGITGVIAEWDGSHNGNGNITGSLTVSSSANPLVLVGLQTGSAAGEGSFLGVSSNGTIVLTTPVASAFAPSITDDLNLIGNISASLGITGSTFHGVSFHGSGANLTNLPVQTYSNATNNRILTSAGSDSINGEANLLFDGSTLTGTGDATVAGDVTINEKIIHNGDTTTFISFPNNNRIGLTANNSNALTIYGNTTPKKIEADNYDFSVMGTSNTPIIFADFSADKLGVMSSAPTHTLSVTGTMAVSGDATFYSNISSSVNISASYFYGDGSKLTNLSLAGWPGAHSGTALVTGSLVLSASSNPLNLVGVQSGSAAGLGSYLALDSNNNLVVTASVGTGGATSFADSITDDLNIIGDISASLGITGSTFHGVSFHGSGASLTNLPVQTYSNATDNRVLTSAGADSINGEANLLFDGSTLSVTGDVSVAGDISINEKIIHNGNTNTHMSFPNNNRIKFTANNNEALTIYGNTTPARIDIKNHIVSASAGMACSRTEVASNYTASVNDYFLGVSASATLEILLPKASNLLNGQVFTVKDEAGNANSYNIKINLSGSDTVDGANNITLESPYAAVNLYTNGSNKFFIY